MRHRIALVGLLAACGSREEQVATGSSRSVAPVLAAARQADAIPDPFVVGVPHGPQITFLATTDEADAAITADEVGSLRLWPTLDGSREPVVVSSASAAQQLALVHDGRDLVAAILDTSGGIEIIRLGADGRVRGRAQLSAATEYTELVGVGAMLLARTADHVLELYRGDGTLHGRLEVGHGERITDLAARRGKAAAVVATGSDFELRWLGMETSLRWQSSLPLPLEPSENMLAIAPGKHRIAFVDVAKTNLHVFDAALVPVPVPGPKLSINDAHQIVGFIDDDTVGVAGTSIAWWWTGTPSADPWDVRTGPSTPTVTDTGAFGDHRLVSPFRVSLAITDATRTRYLGWKIPNLTSHYASHDQLVMSHDGQQFTWLDENLAPGMRLEVKKSSDPDAASRHGVAIAPGHVIVQTNRPTVQLDLVDANKPDALVSIGSFENMARFEYNDGLLAVVQPDRVRRFRVDLETDTVEELLPALQLRVDSVSWIRLFDPQRSGGLLAAVQTWDSESSDRQNLWQFRQDGARVKKTRMAPMDMHLLRSDATGLMHMFDVGKRSAIVTLRGSKIESRIELQRMMLPVAVDTASGTFAVKQDHDIVLLDAEGTERWRTTVWGATSLTFVGGGKRIAVAAPGGYVALDAATGEIATRACGLEFGLHDAEIQAFGAGMATVCEDHATQ